MENRYNEPTWKTRLRAYAFAAALLGLVWCMLRMGWLCLTA